MFADSCCRPCCLGSSDVTSTSTYPEAQLSMLQSLFDLFHSFPVQIAATILELCASFVVLLDQGSPSSNTTFDALQTAIRGI